MIGSSAASLWLHFTASSCSSVDARKPDDRHLSTPPPRFEVATMQSTRFMAANMLRMQQPALRQRVATPMLRMQPARGLRSTPIRMAAPVRTTCSKNLPQECCTNVFHRRRSKPVFEPRPSERYPKLTRDSTHHLPASAYLEEDPTGVDSPRSRHCCCSDCRRLQYGSQAHG